MPSPASRPSPSSAAHRFFAVAAAVSGCLLGWTGAPAAAPMPPKSSPPPSSSSPATMAPSDEEAVSEARREAEALYAEGYAKVEEAKKDRDAGGKKAAKNARKKFQKAIGRFEDAVARSPEYYEAWNMIGYCARNLGDLTRAFEAYDKALSINPDFDEAHEYLGEAYLQSGDLAKARLQLEWLRNHDSDEAEELAEKIDAAERARGETGGETPKPASDEGAPEPQESSEEAQ